jgi:hypothetical protein
MQRGLQVNSEVHMNLEPDDSEHSKAKQTEQEPLYYFSGARNFCFLYYPISCGGVVKYSIFTA